MTRIILDFADERSNSDAQILELVRKKAVERQYHTYFQWGGKNANQFFSLFGADFLEYMKSLIKSDKQLELAVEAFLELGELRNRLVHQNFGTFALEKTVDEIFKLYKSANVFIDDFPTRLREGSQSS